MENIEENGTVQINKKFCILGKFWEDLYILYIMDSCNSVTTPIINSPPQEQPVAVKVVSRKLDNLTPDKKVNRILLSERSRELMYLTQTLQ